MKIEMGRVQREIAQEVRQLKKREREIMGEIRKIKLQRKCLALLGAKNYTTVKLLTNKVKILFSKIKPGS